MAAFAEGKLDGQKAPLHAYNAACAALRVAGREEARAEELRSKALAWLRASLTGWQNRLEREGGAAALAKRQLDWWQQDPDLESVRGVRLLSLPSDGRSGWQKLWKDWEAARR